MTARAVGNPLLQKALWWGGRHATSGYPSIQKERSPSAVLKLLWPIVSVNLTLGITLCELAFSSGRFGIQRPSVAASANVQLPSIVQFPSVREAREDGWLKRADGERSRSTESVGEVERRRRHRHQSSRELVEHSRQLSSILDDPSAEKS